MGLWESVVFIGLGSFHDYKDHLQLMESLDKTRVLGLISKNNLHLFMKID